MKESSCSPIPALQLLLYTISPMRSLSTSCITSTLIPQRLVSHSTFFLAYCICDAKVICVRRLMAVLSTQLMAENVFDVLCVADMYLLPGLKCLCGKTLAKTICEDNVLQMWKTARLFRLSRLEDQCTEFMAKIIERVGVCVCLEGAVLCLINGRGLNCSSLKSLIIGYSNLCVLTHFFPFLHVTLLKI